MAFQIIAADINGLSIGVNLGTTDDAIVLAGVTVGSTGDYPISGLGSSHRVNIYGSAVGVSGVRLGDAASDDSGQELIVHEGGLIHGEISGAFITGYSSSVTNAGTIFGGSHGLLLSSQNIATHSAIRNTGTIRSDGYGIFRPSSSTEILLIDNSGLIKADKAIYTGTSVAEEKVTNTGRIVGSIHLFGGDDIYDGRFGTVTDRVEGGDGTDRLLGGSAAETFHGGGDADTLRGYAGNDVLYGDSGNDRLEGGAGNDFLYGGSGNDRMEGGTGNDIFYVFETSDAVVELSGQGTDLVYAAVNYTLTHNFENLFLIYYVGNLSGTGNALSNTITGNDGNNTLKGLSGNDTLLGGTGNDQLEGGTGIDKLTGGAGADKLYGGAGADQFIFTAVGDSTVASSGRDTIYDFSHAQGDRIVLSSIDADSAASGNQAFSFIGAAAFSGDEGELRYSYAGSKTVVQGDVDGDGAADLAILLSGKIALVAGDLVL